MIYPHVVMVYDNTHPYGFSAKARNYRRFRFCASSEALYALSIYMAPEATHGLL